jgi:hypothetical protein
MINKILIFVFIFAFAENSLKGQVPSYIPMSGLQAWYPFNGNANDDSGSGHDGTVSGATLTSDRFGIQNAAYMFGANKYVSVSDDVNFRPSVFTISSWVTFTSTPSNYNLIIAKNIGSSSPESIDINYATSYNSWLCNVGNATSLGPFITSTQNVTVGTWYNLVYQFDDINNIQKIFVNGVLTTTANVATSIDYDTKPWTIGMEYENNIASFFFSGKIDDIGIWNRLLSQQEITEVFQSNPTGIKENIIETSFCTVFPNPAKNKLSIDISNDYLKKIDDNVVLKIYSSEGKLVQTTELNRSNLQNLNNINIGYLSDGLYVLNLSSGNYHQKMKFIKE